MKWETSQLCSHVLFKLINQVVKVFCIKPYQRRLYTSSLQTASLLWSFELKADFIKTMASVYINSINQSKS